MQAVAGDTHVDRDIGAEIVVYTDLRNSDFAHYALGVSGHGIVTRNKDGDGATFSGYDAKAISVGLTYDF